MEKTKILNQRLGLESLQAPLGARKRKKILGRGPSSGHGKTSGRGVKGQTSRAGRHFYVGFEGGSVPTIRKIPKRGFYKTKKEYQIVNLDLINRLKIEEIDPVILEKERLIKDKNKKVKILGRGEIGRPLTVKAHAFSKQAKEKIEKANGKIEIIK